MLVDGVKNTGQRKEKIMKEKIVKWFLGALEVMGSYKTLAIVWLILGIMVLVIGDISRLSYFSVWAVLMMEMLFHAIDEQKKK